MKCVPTRRDAMWGIGVHRPTKAEKRRWKLNMKRVEEAERKQQWFETFRLAAITIAATRPTDYKGANVEAEAKKVADLVEKHRPKSASYATCPPVYGQLAGASAPEEK
jgi:hypothetical protein